MKLPVNAPEQDSTQNKIKLKKKNQNKQKQKTHLQLIQPADWAPFCQNRHYSIGFFLKTLEKR